MTFAHPIVLWLAAIPFALLVCDVATGVVSDALPRVRRLWAGPSGLAGSAVRKSRRRWFLWLGLMLVVVAAARPQWGKIQEETFDQSREVLLALDLSRSMLAEDVKPSRLARAKLLIESLLDKLKGERVGLILFSGTAFLQSPLSPDYEVLREFLPEVGPDYLPEGGTDFNKLLETALDSFSNDGGADRFLIVLSDGESQTNDWRERIEKMKQRNIRVITLGIGTEEGAVMPAEGGGFVKDERGAVVLSKLQPQTLRDLARLTSGTYANAASWVDLAKLINDTVDRGAKGAFSKRSEIRMKERYQWFLATGMLLLALSYWREFPVQPRVRDLRRHHRAGAAAAAICIAIFVGALVSQDLHADPPALSDLAKTLSEQPALSAADAASFANATIGFGEEQRQTGKPIPPSVLQDGMQSVDLGERTDSKAADWSELRRKLEELAKPPEEQKQDKKDEKKKDEEKKDQQQQQKGGGQDQQKQDKGEKQDQSGQQQQDKQDQQNEKRSGQKAFDDSKEQQEQQQNEQPQPDEQDQQQQKKSMQLVGGEETENKELKETPELVVPLQKLDKVKQQDSPPRLFQILQNEEPKPKEKKGKDW